MTTHIKNLGFFLIALALIVSTNSVHVFAAPAGAADYRSSLTTGILSSDTSLTVVSTTTPSGENLIQGYTYGLKLGGREYALGVLGAGKTFTGVTRGVSNINGTTTGGVAQSWGRGSTVEITDAPVLLEIINKIAGRDFIGNVLRYTGVSTTTLATNGNNLASVDYVNDVAFGAVPQASETTAGFIELATGAEIAAGTSIGATTARLAIGANLATSTYNSATAANVIPVTGGSGTIDGNFLPTTIPNAHTFTGAVTGATSTWSGNLTLSGSATSTIASSTLYATTTTGTWTKPSNLKYIRVTVVGGGGDAGGGSTYGGPGGGGARCEKIIPAAALASTVTVTVGAAGSASSGGSSSFGSFCTAGGGARGSDDPGSGGTTNGGAGGSASGGDINITGESAGLQARSNAVSSYNVPGGRSLYYTYGRGSSGTGSIAGGGTATQGIVVIESFFY